jgi:hypothetical protein
MNREALDYVKHYIKFIFAELRSESTLEKYKTREEWLEDNLASLHDEIAKLIRNLE